MARERPDSHAVCVPGAVAGSSAHQPTYDFGLYALRREAGHFHRRRSDAHSEAPLQNNPRRAEQLARLGQATPSICLTVREDRFPSFSVRYVEILPVLAALHSTLASLAWNENWDRRRDFVDFREIALINGDADAPARIDVNQRLADRLRAKRFHVREGELALVNLQRDLVADFVSQLFEVV